MQCQCCEKKTAQIRVCDIEENSMTDQFALCTDCWPLVRKVMMDGPRLVATNAAIAEVRQMLDGAGKALKVVEPPGPPAAVAQQKAESACPECGITLSEFRKGGRFGCANDYEMFSEHLETLLERIHETTPPRHRGRLPKPRESGFVTDRLQEISRLQEQLDQAVRDEAFERAAELRDRIGALQGEGSAKKSADGERAGGES